ncbi:MAG TPA: hypothetical protein VJU59_02930, partial [Paraburkholderia sp.]|uniref:hypothetical protein n=1 Tax=Paraburkholderia sp. TaxID=1926495 RepID=UPI002B496356
KAALVESFLIGETGFSFGRSERPMLPLEQWRHDEIPETAREVLQTQGGFHDFVALIRAAIASDALGGTRAEWVLGRSSLGLLSITVRDGSRCEAHRLRDDVTFSVSEANRYCGVAAIVLVQQGQDDAKRCLDSLQEAFSLDVVKTDVLYKSSFASKMPVWFASLSYRLD